MKHAPLLLACALALCWCGEAARAQGVTIVSVDSAPAKKTKKTAAKKKGSWRKTKAAKQQAAAPQTAPETLSQSAPGENAVPATTRYQKVKEWDGLVGKAWAASSQGKHYQALRIVSSITAQGYPPAMAVTGAFYYALRDYASAVRYTRSAAQKGNLPAMLTMAEYCFKGLGPDQLRDCEAGISWLRQAAEENYVPAMMRMAAVYEKGSCGAEQNLEEAFEWYHKAGKLGSALAQYRVGMAYRRGKGVTPDPDEAVAWLAKSAAKKYGPALAALGYFYKEGVGVERDYDKALEYFKSGDLNGDPQALAALADMYLNGLGVEQDTAKGLQMLEAAGAAGYRAAYQKLAEIFYNAGDYPRAFNYYRTCGSQGGLACQARLCYMYWAGNPPPQNTPQAYVWCAAAAYLGSPEGISLFAQVKNYNFMATDAVRAAKAEATELVKSSLNFYRTHSPETEDEAQLQKEALAQEKEKRAEEAEAAAEEAAPQEQAQEEEQQ